MTKRNGLTRTGLRMKLLMLAAFLSIPAAWAAGRNDSQLITASRAGDAALVQSLLAQGADANARMPDEGTPLMCASVYGHSGIVLQLLQSGADVDLKDKKGRTALMFAASHGHHEIVRALAEAGARLDEQAWGVCGVTALMSAAREGWPECARILLKAGADPSVKDSQGATALDYARRNQHKEVGELLEVAGG